MKVGLTGHRYIDGIESFAWLMNILETCITLYDIEQGITSLAIGADQLYAQALYKKQIPLLAVIPGDDYAQTFSNEDDLTSYLHYLRQAFSIIRLSFAKSNDLAYYEAGKCMVDLSDMVLAIWNGLPARGMGGTADIVCYALTHHKRIIHINPLTRTVLELSDVRCVDSYCGITLKA